MKKEIDVHVTERIIGLTTEIEYGHRWECKIFPIAPITRR